MGIVFNFSLLVHQSPCQYFSTDCQCSHSYQILSLNLHTRSFASVLLGRQTINLWIRFVVFLRNPPNSSSSAGTPAQYTSYSENVRFPQVTSFPQVLRGRNPILYSHPHRILPLFDLSLTILFSPCMVLPMPDSSLLSLQLVLTILDRQCCIMVRDPCHSAESAKVQILPLPFTNCVSLGMFLYLSLSHRKSG